ncbi:phage tail tape measure protein [Acidisoma sp. 7E03]
MANELTASFVLKLRDQLSSGLAKLEKQIQRLKDLAKNLTMGGMDKAQQSLDRATASAGQLSKQLATISPNARQASQAVDSLGNRIVYVGRNGEAAVGRINRAIAALPRWAGGSGTRIGGSTVASGMPLLAGPGGGGGGYGGGGFSGFPPLNPGNPFGGGAGGRGFGARLRGLGAGISGYGAGIWGAAQSFRGATQESLGAGMEALVAGFGLTEPIREAAELDNILRHIAITTATTGAAGDKMVADLRRSYQALARATGQSSLDIAEAGFYLIQSGLPKPVVDSLTKTSARIATAYNANPLEVARTAFVANENLHIAPADMAGALASLALAGKDSHFSFPEMAQLFPQVAAFAANVGETGRSGVDHLGAFLAIARKNTATGGEAATNTTDFINQLTSPFTVKRFAELGVDLPKLLANAKKQGADPVETVLAKVQQITHGNPFLVGSIFHNEQSRGFVLAMLQHWDEYESLLKKLQGANPSMVNRDFGEGLKSLTVQLNQFSEALRQLATRAGLDFIGPLRLVTGVLNGVNTALAWMDQHVPGVADVFLTSIGSVLAFVAALGAIGAVFPWLKTGWGVLMAVVRPFGPLLSALLSPIGLVRDALVGLGVPMSLATAAVGAVAIALAAAAITIITNWDQFKPFFVDLWNAVKQSFQGFTDFIAGVFTLDQTRIVKGMSEIWKGTAGQFRALWSIVEGVFGDWLKWLDSWSGGLGSRILAGIKSGWNALVNGLTSMLSDLGDRIDKALGGPIEKMQQIEQFISDHLGGGTGQSAPPLAEAAVPGGINVGGTVQIQVEGPGRVTQTKSANPHVPLQGVAARGPMMGRN